MNAACVGYRGSGSEMRTTPPTSWIMPISFETATARCAWSTTATSRVCFHAPRGGDCSSMWVSNTRCCPSSTPIWSPGSTRYLYASGQFPQNKALQVIRLGHPQHDWMIPALHPLLHDADDYLRVERRVEDHFRERRFVDVVRAAAGNQKPARLQQLERA